MWPCNEVWGLWAAQPFTHLEPDPPPAAHIYFPSCPPFFVCQQYHIKAILISGKDLGMANGWWPLHSPHRAAPRCTRTIACHMPPDRSDLP